jgi:hypothetical protein
MNEHPLPLSREDLQYEIAELEKAYHQRYLTDPVFHARSRMIGNFLDQLESVHQAGDTERVGFLIAAAMERALPREVQSEAWARGVSDAMRAAITRTAPTNPYLEES